MAQESPIHSWNRIWPSVVCASKSGAGSPILSIISLPPSSPHRHADAGGHLTCVIAGRYGLGQLEHWVAIGLGGEPQYRVARLGVEGWPRDLDVVDISTQRRAGFVWVDLARLQGVCGVTPSEFHPRMFTDVVHPGGGPVGSDRVSPAVYVDRPHGGCAWFTAVAPRRGEQVRPGRPDAPAAHPRRCDVGGAAQPPEPVRPGHGQPSLSVVSVVFGRQLRDPPRSCAAWDMAG